MRQREIIKLAFAVPDRLLGVIRNLTAERVQAAMDAKNWDQSELARRVGCTPAAINQLVLGHTRQSRFLPKIAIELGVSLAYLLGETDNPTSDGSDVRLSSEEREWLTHFRKMRTKDRTAALQLVRTIATSASSK